MTELYFKDFYTVKNIYAQWFDRILKVGSMISYVITAITVIRFLVRNKYENYQGAKIRSFEEKQQEGFK